VLMEQSVEQTIQQIQDGDAAARELLIRHYRPFVLRTVRYICKRSIDWNDDEASIGLIGFDAAIDRYDATKGKTFDNFAYLIIRNRLIDEFRRQGKQDAVTVSLHPEEGGASEHSPGEIAVSLEAYERASAAEELAQELMRYDEVLQDYGVSLEDLEEQSPQHQDSRINLIRIARTFNAQKEWLSHLERTRSLPIKEMLKSVSVSRRTLERNRKYLIALIVMYSCDEFVRIRNTVSFAGIGE